MKIWERKTHKLFLKLNAYNDVVKANYTYFQLDAWDRGRVRNLGETAWKINKLNKQKK